MAVNGDFVGRSLPAAGPVCRGCADAGRVRLGGGLAATACTPPQRGREAAGYQGVIAPPTFAVTLAQRCDSQLIEDPEAGIDYSRVVHGEQRFVHHRPITAGDQVMGALTVDSVRQAGGHAMVTTRTELTTADGEALCTSTSTIVIRGGE